jgi:hypothetical protein
MVSAPLPVPENAMSAQLQVALLAVTLAGYGWSPVAVRASRRTGLDSAVALVELDRPDWRRPAIPPASGCG